MILFRIQLLLVSLCNVTDRWLFYNALWTSVLTVPSARLPALVFVQSQLTKGATPEDQQHFFGDDLLTMVSFLLSPAESFVEVALEFHCEVVGGLASY